MSKRNREIEFEDFYDSNLKCSKNWDKYYDQDDSDPFSELTHEQLIENIKKSIHKNDLDMFKLLVDNYELSEPEIYEVVELLLSTKFFEALVHFTEISDSVRDIISEDFETMIEEYGLEEDSIFYYFECFPKKMFKTLIESDNTLFSEHVRNGYCMYLLSEIRKYIDNKRKVINDNELFLHNARKNMTFKIIQVFSIGSNPKKDYQTFELVPLYNKLQNLEHEQRTE